MMETLKGLSIGPVEAVVLIGGITQFVKAVFTLGGKEAQVLTFVVGFIVTAVAYAFSEGMIPAEAEPYVALAAVALGGAIAAMGYYDLLFKGKGSRD